MPLDAREGGDIGTFERLRLSLAQSMEVARDNLKQLQSPTGAASTAPADSVQLVDRKPCYRCRQTSHKAAKCPHKEAKCHQCGKIGHLKRACLNKAVKAVEEDIEHHEEPIKNITALSTVQPDSRG